jgi:hypothetical protein
MPDNTARQVAYLHAALMKQILSVRERQGEPDADLRRPTKDIWARVELPGQFEIKEKARSYALPCPASSEARSTATRTSHAVISSMR